MTAKMWNSRLQACRIIAGVRYSWYGSKEKAVKGVGSSG